MQNPEAHNPEQKSASAIDTLPPQGTIDSAQTAIDHFFAANQTLTSNTRNIISNDQFNVLTKKYREDFLRLLNSENIRDGHEDPVEDCVIKAIFHSWTCKQEIPLVSIKELSSGNASKDFKKSLEKLFNRLSRVQRVQGEILLPVYLDELQVKANGRANYKNELGGFAINPVYEPTQSEPMSMDAQFMAELSAMFSDKQIGFEVSIQLTNGPFADTYTIPVLIDVKEESITLGDPKTRPALKFGFHRWKKAFLKINELSFECNLNRDVKLACQEIQKWLHWAFDVEDSGKIEIQKCPKTPGGWAKDWNKCFSALNKCENYISQFWFPDSESHGIAISVFPNDKPYSELKKKLAESWIVYGSNGQWMFPQALADGDGEDEDKQPDVNPSDSPSVDPKNEGEHSVRHDLEHGGTDERISVVGKVLSTVLWFAILYDINNSSKSPEDAVPSLFTPQLPSIKSHISLRNVDIEPFSLRRVLENKGFYYKTSALNSLAMALNSGDHVILTGPPGAGKTALATLLPTLLSPKQNYILCTASPDWTTNELIGRYMPNPKNNGDAILEFEPGFFLQAIDDRKWLIIDELNRADIDSCMGPLFSVLSGQAVVLPYKLTDESIGNAESDSAEEVEEKSAEQTQVGTGGAAKAGSSEDKPEESKQQGDDLSSGNGITGGDDLEKNSERRVGICLEGKKPEGQDQDVYWYEVPEDFRIVCTMNDSDAGMLNQLSYALQRRFSVIRVEAPPWDIVKTCIVNEVHKQYDSYTSEKDKGGMGRKISADFGLALKKSETERDASDDQDELIEGLKALFASGKEDLMQLRVVGFGQILDIIKMVIEGLSYKPNYTFLGPQNNGNKWKKDLIRTLLANAVVMKVFPQLPAFMRNKEDQESIFKPALKLIAKVFKRFQYCEFDLCEGSGDALKIQKLDIPGAQENPLWVYLKDELRLLFRNQNADWEDAWNDATDNKPSTGTGTNVSGPA